MIPKEIKVQGTSWTWHQDKSFWYQKKYREQAKMLIFLSQEESVKTKQCLTSQMHLGISTPSFKEWQKCDSTSTVLHLRKSSLSITTLLLDFTLKNWVEVWLISRTDFESHVKIVAIILINLSTSDLQKRFMMNRSIHV